MRSRTVACLASVIAFLTSPTPAQTIDETLGTDSRVESVDPERLILKDPLIAGWMSATVPGLGQAYAGRKGRGLLFFLGTIGAVGATAAFIEPADLDISGYDRVEYGGNGDGGLSVAELQNWEDREFQGDAFESLSTGRQVGAIVSVTAGIGVYVWNIIDARRLSREANREAMKRRIELGLAANEHRTGVALSLNF